MARIYLTFLSLYDWLCSLKIGIDKELIFEDEKITIRYSHIESIDSMCESWTIYQYYSDMSQSTNGIEFHFKYNMRDILDYDIPDHVEIKPFTASGYIDEWVLKTKDDFIKWVPKQWDWPYLYDIIPISSMKLIADEAIKYRKFKERINMKKNEQIKFIMEKTKEIQEAGIECAIISSGGNISYTNGYENDVFVSQAVSDHMKFVKAQKKLITFLDLWIYINDFKEGDEYKMNGLLLKRYGNQIKIFRVQQIGLDTISINISFEYNSFEPSDDPDRVLITFSTNDDNTSCLSNVNIQSINCELKSSSFESFMHRSIGESESILFIDPLITGLYKWKNNQEISQIG